jgi:hypothetical protein
MVVDSRDQRKEQKKPEGILARDAPRGAVASGIAEGETDP